LTGANLGLSLTLNLEQYEDLAGDDDEAGVVVCTKLLLPLHTTDVYFVRLRKETYIVYDFMQTNE